MVVQYGRIEMIKLKIHSVSKKKLVVVKRSFHKNTKIGQMMNKWKKKMKMYLKKKNYFYVEDEGAVFLFFKYSKFMEYLVVMMMMMMGQRCHRRCHCPVALLPAAFVSLDVCRRRVLGS
ncbi:hypothetical protein T02_12683 [Trichinella nativa]|uniref:Uncharacterized protein n=1 Tax=Trichinella nativa TaxID=6335 RepID=A0A0V1L117_9BILA|nr:hypothetical protein T02_12683 [Trichinella nativa]